jgi:tyrosinase
VVSPLSSTTVTVFQKHYLTHPSRKEPLFYLHHAQVDHVYWQWQQKNPAVRLHEVGGKTIRNDATSPNVTADFKVNLGAIAPSIPISDLLDTEGGVLCYTYE